MHSIACLSCRVLAFRCGLQDERAMQRSYAYQRKESEFRFPEYVMKYAHNQVIASSQTSTTVHHSICLGVAFLLSITRTLCGQFNGV